MKDIETASRSSPSAIDENEPLGHQLMRKMADAMLVKLETYKGEIDAASLNAIRLFLSDQSITLASIKRGDLGHVAKTVVEEFPFDENDEPLSIQ